MYFNSAQYFPRFDNKTEHDIRLSRIILVELVSRAVAYET